MVRFENKGNHDRKIAHRKKKKERKDAKKKALYEKRFFLISIMGSAIRFERRELIHENRIVDIV